MAVDEANLVIVIRSLKASIAMYESKLNEGRRLLNLMRKIEMVDGAYPPDTDLDSTGGTTVSTTRRDEIYDGNIAAANTLLGITS